MRGAARDRALPREPGLYRIRREGRDDLDYIGQTGLPLPRRLGMLQGAFAEAMPYRDPHTAAPGLWALRHVIGCDFEVSVADVPGGTAWRKGLEAVAITLYRQGHGRSPTLQFGRMPVGYRASSGNNATLVRAGRRFRGGLMAEREPSHRPGVPPAGPLIGEPQAADWGGLAWSAWMPLAGVTRQHLPVGSGLYRLRGKAPCGLLYVGEGLVRSRILAHLAKRRDLAHAQGQILAANSALAASWVLEEGWLPHQRLELETDLIAARVLATGTLPAMQFLG